MATSEKIKAAGERAKEVALEEKQRLEGAAHRAQDRARERGAELKERIAEAREHVPHANGK